MAFGLSLLAADQTWQISSPAANSRRPHTFLLLFGAFFNLEPERAEAEESLLPPAELSPVDLRSYFFCASLQEAPKRLGGRDLFDVAGFIAGVRLLPVDYSTQLPMIDSLTTRAATIPSPSWSHRRISFDGGQAADEIKGTGP